MPKATKSRKKPSESPEKKPATTGRPTDYRPELCQIVVDIAKRGPSTLVIIACELGVHRDTLHEWSKVHPEFSDAIKMVKQYQEANMQKIGLAGMVGKLKGFSAGTWIFYMKAQFNWDEGGILDQDEIEPIFD